MFAAVYLFSLTTLAWFFAANAGKSNETLNSRESSLQIIRELMRKMICVHRTNRIYFLQTRKVIIE
jgi:hypothetical protein